ncbi:hypothetical protein [Algoriphagus lacus]|nr:hypothetical protein [Algoriphagus lacus]
MNRRFSSLLLLSSWILGISLICLFPPVSDYSPSDLDTGCITKECLPELNLKNSSRSRVAINLDGFMDFQSLTFDPWTPVFGSTEVLQVVFQRGVFAETFFDVKIYFRKFFENF